MSANIVCLTWCESDPLQEQIAQYINALQEDMTRQQCYLSDGIFVKVDIDQVHAEVNTRDRIAILIGDVFNQPGKSYNALIELLHDFDINQNTGNLLNEYIWGNYVLIIYDRIVQKLLCIKSPMSLMPIYFISNENRCLITQKGETFRQFPGFEPAFNWSYLIHRYIYYGQPDEETGLLGVRQLPQGCQLECHSNIINIHTYWSMFPNSIRIQHESINEIAAGFKDQIVRLMESWSSGFSKCLVQLSGGLDSAVLLAALRESKSAEDIICFNYYEPGTTSDERTFAREAADHMGVHLIEGEMRSAYSVEALAATAHLTLEPNGQMFGHFNHREIQKRAQLFDADFVFTGNGGDQVFGATSGSLMAQDFLMDHGIKCGVLNVARYAAVISGESIWTVLRQMFGVIKKPHMHVQKQPALVAHDIFSNKMLGRIAKDYENSVWESRFNDFPPAKSSQIQSLYMSLPQATFSQQDQKSRICHPFFSQPIVEYCLSLPSYILNHQGISRGLLRLAFMQDIPMSIRNRQWKGATNSFFYQFIQNQKHSVSELICGGLIAREGFVDLKLFKKMLNNLHHVAPENMRVILRLLDLEIWLNRWHS